MITSSTKDKSTADLTRDPGRGAALVSRLESIGGHKTHKMIAKDQRTGWRLRSASCILGLFLCNGEEYIVEGGDFVSYYFSKTLNVSFDDAVKRVIEALKKEGFGVLTDINVKETLKKKLNVEFRNYRILGACNPPFAYQALQAEDKIGTMLPCNVVVQENSEGKVEVAAIDPVASMQAIDNPDLGDIAGQVRSKLKNVVDGL